MASEMPTDTSHARSDARVPQMTRESTSRPISSVPNQWAAVGALRTALQLVASGSYGAIHDAKIASATKKTTTASPTMAPRRRSNRRSARSPGESSRGRAMSAKAIAAMSGAHPRIDQHVGHVREEVQHDVGGRREEHHALDHRVVAVEDRIDVELSEPGYGEHLLGEHRVGEKR